MIAVIHCEPRIPWQGPFAQKLAAGLRRHGVTVRVTESRSRQDEGFPILLGTTRWRPVEREGTFLLVDRCSFGDTNRFVSLVWNGRGRRGVHCMPENPGPERWEEYGTPVQPWKPRGWRVVLCGQTESYSPHYTDLREWYRAVPEATHFRPHPAGENPTRLPQTQDFANATAVTLNSSVGVQCVLDGIPTITMDEGSMAWDITGHSLKDVPLLDREPWLWRLAWTQWTHDEIQEGTPWEFLL